MRWIQMRNLVVCCDGTGNEISENISNVLKLYRVLRKTEKTTPRQIAFYDPGVGTLARPDPWVKAKQDFIALLGLATGFGLDDSVLRAYSFLIDKYEDGDNIFLFGFSRGAYSVRVLAGLIHKVGLLAPEQRHLAGAALTAYKQTSLALLGDEVREEFRAHVREEVDDWVAPPAHRDDIASQFSRIVSSRWATIRFLGVWDTVASVIVPRPDRFYTFSLEKLAFTQANPSVKVFRQAMAIDERRRMFRLESWKEPQSFMHNRFSVTNNYEPQDALQVWFAGVHADIGGGYPERESSLSKFPLRWMIGEAAKCGLAFNPQSVHQLVEGIPRKGSSFTYIAPDFMRAPHQSMNFAWRALEYIPKADRFKEWQSRPSRLGFYIPAAEPRMIYEGANIHKSVVDRMNAVPAYAPVNFPSNFQIVA